MAAVTEAQQPDFILFRQLGFTSRFACILGALSAGIVLQLLVVWWVGLPFIVFAVLLSLCKSVSNEADPVGTPQWENVTLDEFRKILIVRMKSKQWAAGLFGTSRRWLLPVLIGAGILVALVLDETAQGNFNLRNAFIGDAAVMLILTLTIGVKKAWEPQGLCMKLEPLLNLSDYLKTHPDPLIETSPMLEVKGPPGKQVPDDCKMMLKLKGAPETFLGIQVQTSLNDVQGTKYPYMYCVLLAKLNAGMIAKLAPLLGQGAEKLGFFANANDKKNPDLQKLRYRGEIVETSVAEVEIVVVRQVTLGKGYYTTPSDQIRVAATAIDLAKKVCGM